MKTLKGILLTSIFVAITFAVLYNFLPLKDQPAKTTNAEETSKSNIHVIFTESKLPGDIGVFEKDNNKFKKEKELLIVQKYEVWINSDGYFRLNYLDGPNEGDYMVWDGQNVYQYTKSQNELVINKEKKDANVVPHFVFSQEISNRLESDHKKGKVKKEKEQKVLKRDSSVYINEVEFDNSEALVEKFPTIYKEKGNKEISRMYVDSELNIALATITKTNGKITSEIKMELLEENQNFDQTLLQINKSDIDRIIDLTKN
jgi:outer membrane lipoprotein-sorting protein